MVGVSEGNAVGATDGEGVGAGTGVFDGARVANVGATEGTAVLGCGVGSAVGMPVRWCVGRYILAPASGAYWHAVYPALISCASAQPTASTARSPYLSFQAASPDLRVVHVPAAAPYFRLQLRAQFPPTAE